MTTVVSLSDMPRSAGTPLGPSSWIEVSQERIDDFAETTEDRQWIHVDRVRAASGPFGTPIAHGFLTLSFLSRFVEEMLSVVGGGMAVNYGLERVRFPAPVPAGARVRASGEIASVIHVGGGVQAVLELAVHAEGESKPVCVAQMVIRYLEAPRE